MNRVDIKVIWLDEDHEEMFLLPNQLMNLVSADQAWSNDMGTLQVLIDYATT